MNAPAKSFRFVSTDRRVREDRRFVVGKGRFAADITVPGMRHVALVTSPHPAARILIFTSTNEATYAKRTLRAGAHGYINKNQGLEAVKIALEKITRGEYAYSDAVQRSLFAEAWTRRPNPYVSQAPACSIAASANLCRASASPRPPKAASWPPWDTVWRQLTLHHPTPNNLPMPSRRSASGAAA